VGESAGGLVGYNASGTIANSYARGAVIGEYVQNVPNSGGLIGYGEGAITSSYSTGSVTGPGWTGGFIGSDECACGDIAFGYWDTDMSGITNLSQGAGNIANDPGITGLSTAQLQSGLPAGFDPIIWGQNPNINGGLPYLLANPPPK
jgi:hypothetical protein